MRRAFILSFIGALTAVAFLENAGATLEISNKDDWKFTASGFVELDAIVDSVRTFREVIGNNPIDAGDTANGANGRTQFSVRNSRLAFGIEAPKAGSWKTRGYLEYDLVGFDPAPGASNTEAGFYNNPTLRVRHAIIDANSDDGWQAMAGQYWMLLGWQPYYFLTTADTAPIPGWLYARTAQLRGMKTLKWSDDTLQIAAAILRPPQSESQYPDLQAGLRYALGGRASAFTGGPAGAHKLQPMSFALSGAARQFAIPSQTGGVGDNDHFTGTAWAANVMIPILASDDGKSVGNTLTLVGEYSAGSGYGDQFSGWTGNIASPLSQAAVGTAKTGGKTVNLDGGIGDYDTSGNFQLVKLQTYNAHLQYHLPGDGTDWVDAGYVHLDSSNINNLVTAAGVTSANKIPYNRQNAYFVNYFHDFTAQIRTAVEYVYVDTLYANGVNPADRRYQLSAWFIF